MEHHHLRAPEGTPEGCIRFVKLSAIHAPDRECCDQKYVLKDDMNKLEAFSNRRKTPPFLQVELPGRAGTRVRPLGKNTPDIAVVFGLTGK